MTREQLTALAAEKPDEAVVSVRGEIIAYDPAEWARITLRLMDLADPTAVAVGEDPHLEQISGRFWDLDSQ